MAVAIQMDYADVTLAQYDQVMEKLGPQLAETGAAGGVYHWCAGTDTGIRIVDVWESKTNFDSFYADLLRPTTASLGIPEPTISALDIHNHFTAPG